MSQPIRGQGGHLDFSDRLEKHKHCRGRWDLASGQVSLNSFLRFQRRSRKCEKLTTTDDGQRTITIVHVSLRLRCNKNVSANQKPGDHLVFPIDTKNTKLLRSCFLASFVEFRSTVLLLAETFSTSLKPLNGIQRNLTVSKISTSSTKFVFFGPIEEQDGRPGLSLAETFSTSPKPLNGSLLNSVFVY